MVNNILGRETRNAMNNIAAIREQSDASDLRSKEAIDVSQTADERSAYQKERVDMLIANGEQPEEVVDLRKGVDGKEYVTAGERVKAEYEQLNTGISLQEARTDYIVNVKQPPYNAKGDGSDETAKIQQIMYDYPYGCDLVVEGVITIKSLLFPPTFKGRVIGTGTLKALPNTSIERMVDLSNTSGIDFEVNIDMSQTESTLPNDPRAKIGLYARDAVDLEITKVRFSNCRIARPFFITGTSSNGIDPKLYGSKNVIIKSIKIEAFHYDDVDEGCYPVISSDFYASDGGGAYLSASNGIRKSDYTVDQTVTYPATTSNITVSDIYAEKCDRIAILNVDKIKFHNCDLEDFWTRGYNFSPTCTNFSVTGGTVTGGDATQLAAAYGSNNGDFDGIKIYPSQRATGEKTSLKAYVGCDKITYSNITGVANYDRGIYTHSSKSITFDNVKLDRNPITVTRAVEVSSADNETVNYVVSDIKFKNCYLEGNTALSLNTNVGNSSIATGGVTFDNTVLNSTSDFFYATSKHSQGIGCLNLIGTMFSSSGTQSILPSKIIANFKSNIGLLMNSIQTITVSALSTVHTFNNVYFLVPHYGSGNSGGDALRNPEVMLYKDGAPLVYGVDWFCDGDMAKNKMDNRIRLYDSAKVPVGSKLTLVRNN